MVEVIAHRGLWRTVDEQNTLGAFRRAFELGVGVEVDVRDWCGRVVVSHDPSLHFPRDYDDGENYPPLFVPEILGSPLLVNIKSSGLLPLLNTLTPPEEWYFFDMADAELEDYRSAGLPYFVRSIESSPRDSLPTTKEAAGVVARIDRGLSSTWFEGKKKMLFLSPELYGQKSIREDWEMLRDWGQGHAVMLLTDKVESALEFFK